MAETAQFLDYCHAHDPQSADLVELLIGTGIRKGEALALHWADVNLDEGVLRVRWTLSAVDNNRLVLTAPKTRASRNWVALSGRVTQALERRAAAGESPDGLVFHRADGRPLHPEYTLNHFHLLCARAGVPVITLHDLRHLAATISITEGVPLVVVSKTLRHSTLSTTANIYSHLTSQAVDQISRSLDHAGQPTRQRPEDATTSRPPPPPDAPQPPDGA